MIESINVILWDKKIGALVANRKGYRNKNCFYFDSNYVRDGYDIAPLCAPIKGVPCCMTYRSIRMKSGFSTDCRHSSLIRWPTIEETPYSTNEPKYTIFI